MTTFAHVKMFDPAQMLDQAEPRDAGLNPAACIGWMRTAGGTARVLLLGGQYLDLPITPEAFEEACRTAGLGPA